jgi:alkanesulfonate monooxygenase SsuD/methylene tetrahydromethanopterin reductase-like flavin-dependent oxidoreductase (luciferase family)
LSKGRIKSARSAPTLAAGDRIAVGSRDDDYIAAGADFSKRGRVLDEVATTMRKVWSGAPISDGSPLSLEPVHIPLLFGGRSKATLRRATTVGDGWVAGALRDYKWQADLVELVRKRWQDAGRTGDPQNHASVNFAIGDRRVADSGRDHLAQ